MFFRKEVWTLQDKSVSYKAFRIINFLFLIFLAIICILPFLHILAISFSDTNSVMANTVKFLPKGFRMDAYMKIFSTGNLLSSFLVTIKRMLLGTLYSMLMTISVAFPLSFDSSQFPGRKFYVLFFFFSMMFSGGIIPYYMLINELNLMDSIWALVLGGVPISNMIILLNFFRAIPKDIFESARIDGASYGKILIGIFLPLSMPSLATLSMLCLIGHWNDWFGGLIYMKSVANYPLQTYLYNAYQNVSEFFVSGNNSLYNVPRQAIIAAQTIITILPTLVVFPVLQRYVKTGLILGSVKG